ncbi:hypothetical protein C7H09_10395 [Marinobacter fuscus]|uniref:AAA+ ATPase domain-containing protein n=1 Tax=Marinobacter fuscus TaxID=2109942 RepID=A0A2T1KAP0_9GAMM|nr:ATP-binding cassette domain-containing protein [Marinobacter fuscus]PSF07196.1 hypothetical protein C7H09_10395 [Marinobacter fuscus]
MTTIYLTLQDVSYVLPDGRALFSGLTQAFDQQPTGLVGRNGVGKTLLARIERGSTRTEDFDTLADQWDIRQRVQAQLERSGMGHLDAATPASTLSGGERLKGALACLLYADSPPQLLLLDEPDNHLDLPSLQALEALLRGYPGTLVVISHDDSFLGNIALTDYLYGTDQGWNMKPL